MSLDRVPFTTNEQYRSEDLNAIQAVVERYQHDLAGFTARARALTQAGAAAVTAVTPAVLLGGLEAASDGDASLLIEPGALLMTNFPAEDGELPLSAYKVAINRAQVAVALPAPLTDTWYIVGGRPIVEDDPAVERRVWNPSTPGWELSNLVKRQRAAMTFEVVAGTATELPVFMPENTVPLYAVFRAAGGGTLDDATHVIDLCPLPPRGRLVDTGAAALVQNGWRMDTELRCNVHADLAGLDLHFAGEALDPLDFVDPTDDAPADGEWWYLYLAPFPALGALCVPRHAQLGLGTVRQQGLLIFSKKPPYPADSMPGGAGPPRTNSVALRAPDPFSGADIPEGSAICFGQLRRLASVLGDWVRAYGHADYVGLLAPAASPAVYFSFSAAAFDSRCPVGARFVDYLLQGSTTESQAFELRDTDSDVTHYYTSLEIPDGDSLQASYSFDASNIPIPTNGQFLPVHAGAAVTWTAYLRGYRF